jgi:predicted DsbA family dithiol-disulfide isomerase
MSISLQIFSDYIWPFCYIGEGIVEKLKGEFELAIEWRGVEIHPETPSGGRPLAELFDPKATSRMMEHLRTMGAAFGITFVDRPFLSNSRLALQAAEFAREAGRFDAFHPALFSAYFSQGLDIGSPEVLSEIARDAGIDAEAMHAALRDGRHLARLREAQEEASRLGVTGVPTFFLAGGTSIVGAQPLDVFRKTLRRVSH